MALIGFNVSVIIAEVNATKLRDLIDCLLRTGTILVYFERVVCLQKVFSTNPFTSF